MAENNLSTIIERIRKLMALAESANEHEAGAAAAKASELLAKYELDLATVEGHWQPEAPEIAKETAPWSASRGTRTAWETELATALARHNRCQILTSKRHLYWIGNKRTLTMVAFLHVQLATRLQILATEAVREYIATMRKEWELVTDPEIDGPFHHTKIGMIAGSGGTTIAYRHSWLMGAVAGIQHQLYEMQRALEKSSVNAKALMVLNSGAIEQFLKDEYGKNLRSHSFGQSNGAGFGDGYQTGKRMPIHSGIGGGTAARSLKGGK